MSDRVDDALKRLREARGSLRCDELRRELEALGFEVRDGKKAGHKVLTHPQIADFFSASYTCGHGKNPEIKPPYIRNICKVIEAHETVLRRLLEENS